MLQRKILIAFIFVLLVGIAVSVRIVDLGNSVQAVNKSFISEKLPLSQRIGELRGVIADEERLLYEYYSFTATRDVFLTQSTQNKSRLGEIVAKLEEDTSSRTEVAELRTRLSELEKLSGELSGTLSKSLVDWDMARALLAQIKPKVRQIEKVLATITSAN